MKRIGLPIAVLLALAACGAPRVGVVLEEIVEGGSGRVEFLETTAG